MHRYFKESVAIARELGRRTMLVTNYLDQVPADLPPRDGVALLPLAEPRVDLRAYAVSKRGRGTWPPLTLVLSLL